MSESFFDLVGDKGTDYDDEKPNPVRYDEKHLAATKRWSVKDGHYWGASESCETVSAGIYGSGYSDTIGTYLIQRTVETDDILELPDEASSSLVEEFQNFWTREAEFRTRGFLMKRGFMLWGPPGSGKTCTVNMLIKKLVKDHDGIVLIVEAPGMFEMALRLIRKIEPRRKIIGVMEDIDALIERYGETSFLSVMDGEAQADNIVFVATTNYPERLDRRFVDRPSRFDTIKYIGMPNAASRKVYLKAKEPSLKGKELDNWVELSKGFSIAHLKEMIIGAKCLGQPLEAVVKRLEEMQSRKPTSEDSPEKVSLGFKTMRVA